MFSRRPAASDRGPAPPRGEAAEVVVGELADALAHIVELPARGVGADMLGRAGALLIDVAIDTVPRGYRIAARPGAVTRRAVSMLDEDMDALEEAWETAGLRGGERVVKVQAPGPITLAAGLELANGHRAITDSGALRDLAASLAEGVAAHRAALARRLDTPVVVQFDEPSLPAALGGQLTGVTALSPVAALDEAVAGALLDTCVAAAGADVVLHSCAPDLPWDLLQRSTISAVSVDAGTLRAADLDGIAAFVESGRTVMLGVVPATAPERRPSAEEVATRGGRGDRSARVRPLGAARSHRRHPGMRSGGCDPAVGAHRDRACPQGRRGVRRGPGRHLIRNQKVAFSRRRGELIGNQEVAYEH